jgi:hypothetical protein
VILRRRVFLPIERYHGTDDAHCATSASRLRKS